MPKSNKLAQSPPAVVEQILVELGRNIHIARIRRKLRLSDLAERMGVSRYLISDVEKGKPTIAVAAYISALWAMGLTDDLSNIANPDRDLEGKALENARAPRLQQNEKRY